MIRTGEQYRDSIRDGRQVWINGERVKDVTVHLMFRPLVDVGLPRGIGGVDT
jgi:4-hydroxyphenylacetate 3-monooxygenase